MDNFNDSDDEIPEIDLDLQIQPYLYEPRVIAAQNPPSSSSDESSDGTSEDDDNVHRRQLNTEWCQCGNCTIMPTLRESKCCHEIDVVDEKREDANVPCITQHEGFHPNCLNRVVLEVSWYEFKQENGSWGENEQPHEVYRYIAYRRFARWMWKILGKRNRKVLPSCVVSTIREHFPAEQYCGFKYAI